MIPRLPRVFRHRFYRLAWAGAFISNIGTWMETIAVGIYVAETTGKAGWTGTIAALAFLPSVVLGPLGGVLADRFDRRRYLLAMTLMQAVLAALLAVLAFTHRLSVPVVGIVMFLTGCASSLAGPAFSALLVDFVPPEDLHAAVNLNSGQFNLARVIGPSIAAPVIALGGMGWAFTVNTLSFFAVLFALALVALPPPESHPRRENLVEGMQKGFLAAHADVGIRNALVVTLLASFLVSPFIGLVPAFVIKVLKLGAASTSLLVSCQGVGAIVMAIAVGPLSERFGRRRVLASASFLCGPVAAVYWLSPVYGFAMGALALLGAVHLGTVTGCSSVCQARAPRQLRARVVSIFSMTVGLGYAGGLVALGWFGDLFGMRPVGVVSALVFLALLTLWRGRRENVFGAMDALLQT